MAADAQEGEKNEATEKKTAADAELEAAEATVAETAAGVEEMAELEAGKKEELESAEAAAAEARSVEALEAAVAKCDEMEYAPKELEEAKAMVEKINDEAKAVLVEAMKSASEAKDVKRMEKAIAAADEAFGEDAHTLDGYSATTELKGTLGAALDSVNEAIESKDVEKLEAAVKACEELAYEPREVPVAKELVVAINQALEALKGALSTNSMSDLQGAIEQTEAIQGYEPAELEEAEKLYAEMKDAEEVPIRLYFTRKDVENI